MAAGDDQQRQDKASRAAAPLHIVVFPWLAFGHLLAFLELAKRLAARGHAVTFLSTPRNVARLPPVPTALSGRVRTVALPLPPVEGLPDGAESSADVPREKADLLKLAFDGLTAPFTDFLAAACARDRRKESRLEGFERRPDWIVVDLHHWLCPIADQHQVNYTCPLLFVETYIHGDRRETL